jgi:hypothetical protein
LSGPKRQGGHVRTLTSLSSEEAATARDLARRRLSDPGRELDKAETDEENFPSCGRHEPPPGK